MSASAFRAKMENSGNRTELRSSQQQQQQQY
jgi:hypothetical protein